MLFSMMIFLQKKDRRGRLYVVVEVVVLSTSGLSRYLLFNQT